MSEEQKEYAIDYIMQLQEENYKLEQENKQLKEALLDIKEYIEEHTDKLKTTRVPKINFNYKELYDLVNKALGDKENE